MNDERLDVLIFKQGLTSSRQQAREAVIGGHVFIGGRRVTKPGMRVDAATEIEVITAVSNYVSRGGYKLEKALNVFGVNPNGKVCLDCGASTGGFTDCLLQNGARFVYALDTGHSQLAERIKHDKRVKNMEKTNIRYTKSDAFSEKPELAVIDVSFISLSLVLPAVKGIITDCGEILCLIKPQFETGHSKLGKKGVVKDIETHIKVLEGFLNNAQDLGLHTHGLTHSPLKGAEGNIEYLGFLSQNGQTDVINIKAVAELSHKDLK